MAHDISLHVVSTHGIQRKRLRDATLWIIFAFDHSYHAFVETRPRNEINHLAQ